MKIEPITTWTSELLSGVADLLNVVNAEENITVRINQDWLIEPKEDVREWVVFERTKLIGIVAMCIFDNIAEVTGAIHPAYRCRGIFSSLANTVMDVGQQRGYTEIQWIVSDNAASGEAWVKSRPTSLDRAEYSMDLVTPPSEYQLAADLERRPCISTDLDWITELMMIGFKMQRPTTEEWLNKTIEHPDRTYYGMFQASTPVGVIGVQYKRQSKQAYIYGFVVHPSMRGQGIGGQVLRHLARQLADEGYEVELEVETDNENALGLYTKSGFKTTSINKYYSEVIPAAKGIAQ